jgi:hypothetical protein
MSDQYSNDVYDAADDADSEDDFKNLRAKAKKADRLEPEVSALKRENAFLKAGIPMDDPRMGYFLKGYDGELEADSIRQAAIEAGFMEAPPVEVDPAVQQAQQGQQRVVEASAESQPNFDGSSAVWEMQRGYNEGGLEGLAAITERYGVTFNPE